MDKFLEELSGIHNRCRSFIEQRDHVGFNKFAEELLENNDDENLRANRLKTLLVISKGVPSFFPEITEMRQRVLDAYNITYEKWKANDKRR